ncbi:MAG: hypothetical protein WBW44_12225 [Solirubrobacterales bacterium]
MAVLGGFGVLAAGAQANPVAGGSTSLKLDKRVTKLLKQNGVSVSPVKPAKVKKGAVSFPIKGGKLDPKTAAGTLRHSGGLRFKAGKNKLVTKSFVVKTGSGNRLSARVGKKRVNLLKLDLSNAKVKRPGLGIKVSKVGVSLTGKAAGALNQTFHVNLFKAGLRLGHAVVVAQPKSVGLESEGSTDLTLDPSTAEALTSLGVAVAPVGPASVTQAGAIAFPITGGRANTSTFAGSIAHSGGISLSAGSTVVELTDFRIKVDQTPDLTAKLGDQRVSILDLDLSALEASVTGRKITLANATATLTAGAAAALNSAFGTTAFTEGLVLGNANVNAVAG